MSFKPTQPFDLPELPPQITCINATFANSLLKARTELAELKGYSMALPNPMILLSPAIIKESVASSEIENVNTTVEKVLQQQLFPEIEQRMEDKEVLRYKDAVEYGFNLISKTPLSNRLILGTHRQLFGFGSNGYRSTQNRIQNANTGEVIYTPPIAGEIARLITNWEKYIHKQSDDTDPLIKCAIAHYQFEAIHPFGDGNGRTGRILMVLHLVEQEILHYPILYISGYINRNRSEYYRLLREVTTKKNWCEFIEYILKGFYLQAKETKEQLIKVMTLFREYKTKIKTDCKGIYTGDLVETMFSYPIITPVRLGSLLNIHYTTATRYLKELCENGFLENRPFGKYQLYINVKLLNILRLWK